MKVDLNFGEGRVQAGDDRQRRIRAKLDKVESDDLLAELHVAEENHSGEHRYRLHRDHGSSSDELTDVIRQLKQEVLQLRHEVHQMRQHSGDRARPRRPRDQSRRNNQDDIQRDFTRAKDIWVEKDK